MIEDGRLVTLARKRRKLTDQQVSEIKQKYIPRKRGCAAALATEYGVTASTIKQIAFGFARTKPSPIE